ncbi:protein kintoun [Centroberyx affinis]|uniref:protein kintoun n=1 Tax=Centroberyx affinis TaxID=166261 RepID=UPI003A5C6E99
MEVGEELKELNMTADEIDRLTKAFRDEKFRKMLFDYTAELSDPENKKKYEEEIRLLEQERGNSIDFIHPEPFRALRTSLNGKQKCFINICANEKVAKPEFNWGTSEGGRRGQYWSLPHTLHPGRQDRDPKGNKIMIYDVIFHPDTLHMASRNQRFMDMVDNIAIKGIQDGFKVTLDKNNVREMTIKYKGTPQPSVIKKPIPGYKAKEPAAQPDPLAFPYPDEKRPTTATTAPKITDNGDAKPMTFQIQPQKPKEPTVPNYTLKYRSFIDLQDFRCSRDSAQSPRPKEIVVTIDMPLLKSASDTSLEVNGKNLLLESKKPAYRLELPLAYPVDEDKGEAKFNKQKRQLTITLPVLPSKETFDFAVGPAQTVTDHERQEEAGSGVEGEEKWKEQERRGQESEEGEESGVEELKEQEQKREGEKSEVEDDIGAEKEKWKEQKREGEKSEEEGESGVEKEKSKEQKRKGQTREEGEESGMEEEKEREQKREGQESEEGNKSGVEEKEKWKEQKREGENSEERKESGVEEKKWKEQTRESVTSEEDEDRGVEDEEKWKKQKRERVNSENEERSERGEIEKNKEGDERRDTAAQTEDCCCSDIEEEGGVSVDCFESRAQMKTQENLDYLNGTLNNKVEADTAFLNQISSEKSQTTAAVSTTPDMSPVPNQDNNLSKDCSISQGTEGIRDAPAPNKAKKSNSCKKSVRFSEELALSSAKGVEGEDIDEDDLTTEQTFPDQDTKPPPALLREIDEDRNEVVISDHSTSAGFIFQNSLLFELD